MKKILVIATLSLACASTFADVTATASQNSQAASQASNAGNTQAITFTSPSDVTETLNTNASGHVVTDNNVGGTETIRNVPSVNGPNLTTSNDTCMGSTSGSVNIAGLGIGGGSTWTDTNCVRLKNSRELWNMGMKAAALALMCKDAENKEALELTGFTCPQSKKNDKHATLVTPSGTMTTSLSDVPYGQDPHSQAAKSIIGSR